VADETHAGREPEEGWRESLMIPAWARKLKARIQSDECTLAPEGTWGECCIIHDYHYRVGRSLHDKARADRALRHCMAQHGYPVTGWLYYFAVSTLGLIPWYRKRRNDPPPSNWTPPEARQTYED